MVLDVRFRMLDNAVFFESASSNAMDERAGVVFSDAMARRRSSFKHKRQRMRSTSPLPRRNGATRLEHRVPSSTSRLSTSLLPFRESFPTRKRGPTKYSLSSCPETNARSDQETAHYSKPLKREFRTGAGLRRGGTSSFRLAIAIAQAAANLVRCIDWTASQMIFLIRTFLLCVSQLVRSAQNLIRKLRCDTG